jgi:lipoprotein-releasing system permease protein
VKISWILFISRRYFRVKRKTTGMASSIIALAGLTVGVMALITVLSVMNGFQLGFIENILELSSFHIRGSSPQSSLEVTGDPGAVEKLTSLPGVRAVLPFKDIQTLIQGEHSAFTPVLVRGISGNILQDDPGFVEKLGVFRGDFNISDGRGILVGYDLAYLLGADVGDTISLVSLSGEGFSLLSPEVLDYQVRGLFRSGYYEFDAGLAVVSLEGAKDLARGVPLIYGIKMNDYHRAASLFPFLDKDPFFSHWHIEAWQEFNSAFFGALRLEKGAMMVLMGLIFLVVGVNIYNAQKRNVVDRYEEIGILRSLGASPWSIRSIFLWEGVMIGVSGGLLGTLMGLLVTQNIRPIIGFSEDFLNFFIGGVSAMAALFSGGASGGGTYFSFYLPEVPVRVLYGEVVLIFFFAFTSSLVSAFFASSRVSAIQPGQILRYE